VVPSANEEQNAIDASNQSWGVNTRPDRGAAASSSAGSQRLVKATTTANTSEVTTNCPPIGTPARDANDPITPPARAPTLHPAWNPFITGRR
jgi:hypothetical protein